MLYRDDYHALLSRNEQLERQLAEAREQLDKSRAEHLERQLAEARAELGISDRAISDVDIDEVLRGGTDSTDIHELSHGFFLLAYCATLLFSIATAVAVHTLTPWAFAVAAAMLVPAVWIGTVVVHRAAGGPFERVRFETTVWLPFSLAPVGGIAIASWRAWVLLWGHFGSCSISNGDHDWAPRNYEETGIGRAGWPLAFCYATLAAAQVRLLLLLS